MQAHTLCSLLYMRVGACMHAGAGTACANGECPYHTARPLACPPRALPSPPYHACVSPALQ